MAHVTLPAPDLDHLLGRIRGLRDELRLQVHLLRMDAQGGVRTVADALDDVARRLDAARERGALQTHLAWMDARDRYATIEPALTRALDGVRRSKDGALDALPLEAARLQATLAAMDARDAVEARRKKAAADVRDAEHRAGEALKDLAHRLEPVARAAGGVL